MALDYGIWYTTGGLGSFGQTGNYQTAYVNWAPTMSQAGPAPQPDDDLQPGTCEVRYPWLVCVRCGADMTSERGVFVPILLPEDATDDTGQVWTVDHTHVLVCTACADLQEAA